MYSLPWRLRRTAPVDQPATNGDGSVDPTRVWFSSLKSRWGIHPPDDVTTLLKRGDAAATGAELREVCCLLQERWVMLESHTRSLIGALDGTTRASTTRPSSVGVWGRSGGPRVRAARDALDSREAVQRLRPHSAMPAFPITSTILKSEVEEEISCVEVADDEGSDIDDAFEAAMMQPKRRGKHSGVKRQTPTTTMTHQNSAAPTSPPRKPSSTLPDADSPKPHPPAAPPRSEHVSPPSTVVISTGSHRLARPVDLSSTHGLPSTTTNERPVGPRRTSHTDPSAPSPAQPTPSAPTEAPTATTAPTAPPTAAVAVGPRDHVAPHLAAVRGARGVVAGIFGDGAVGLNGSDAVEEEELRQREDLAREQHRMFQRLHLRHCQILLVAEECAQLKTVGMQHVDPFEVVMQQKAPSDSVGVVLRDVMEKHETDERAQIASAAECGATLLREILSITIVEGVGRLNVEVCETIERRQYDRLESLAFSEALASQQLRVEEERERLLLERYSLENLPSSAVVHLQRLEHVGSISSRESSAENSPARRSWRLLAPPAEGIDPVVAAAREARAEEVRRTMKHRAAREAAEEDEYEARRDVEQLEDDIRLAMQLMWPSEKSASLVRQRVREMMQSSAS